MKISKQRLDDLERALTGCKHKPADAVSVVVRGSNGRPDRGLYRFCNACGAVFPPAAPTPAQGKE